MSEWIGYVFAIVCGSLLALALIVALGANGVVLPGFVAFMIGFAGPWIGLCVLALMKMAFGYR